MKQIKTKLLKTIWNNIHKEEALGPSNFTDNYGIHCALGCTFGKKVDVDTDRHQSDIHLQFIKLNLVYSMIKITDANDDFCGTDTERRVYMLNFIGKELTRRGVKCVDNRLVSIEV